MVCFIRVRLKTVTKSIKYITKPITVFKSLKMILMLQREDFLSIQLHKIRTIALLDYFRGKVVDLWGAHL